MRTLPSALIAEKNQLDGSEPWLVFLEITLPGDEKEYIVRNNEDITWPATAGQLYTAVPFELDMIEDSGSGEIPRVNLKISNVQRMLQGYLESYDGAIGATVKMTIVSVDHLDEDYSEFESTFDVIGSSANYEWVTFTLGAPNPLKQRFPLNKYIAKHCNWHYGSVECGHSGDASCDRTFASCEAKSNAHRFGGYFGLSKIGLRLV